MKKVRRRSMVKPRAKILPWRAEGLRQTETKKTYETTCGMRRTLGDHVDGRGSLIRNVERCGHTTPTPTHDWAGMGIACAKKVCNTNFGVIFVFY